MDQTRAFLDALGFLTRLAPARAAEPARLARCMAHLPGVGLILGGLIVLPFGLGLFSGHPLVQAVLSIAASAWLTRGLHFDGLSDVADATASHTAPERFWAIVKDSRCGAFGALALVLAVALQAAALAALYADRAFGSVAWVFVAGRFAACALGYLVRDLARPGLGGLFLAGATLKATLAALAVTAVSGLFLAPLAGHALVMLLLPLAVLPLFSLARAVRGANGDFLGAAVTAGETVAALALVLAL